MVPDWRSLPPLTALRAFDQAARAGSFAGAARALNVTHAAVAQQVRALEADLGVTLLRRVGRGVVLTAEGTALAQALAEGFDRMAQGVADLRAQAAGRPLQITATVFFVQIVLMPLLDRFWTEHPGFRLSFHPTQEAVDLAAEGLDLALRTSMVPDPDWPGLQAELLLATRRIAVAAPALWRDGTVPLTDLPWIYQSGFAFAEDPMREAGVDMSRVRQIWPGAAMLEISAALRGLGVLIASEMLVREELDNGLLVRVPLPSEAPVYYFAATPKGPMRPQTRVFIDWLKTALVSQA